MYPDCLRFQECLSGCVLILFDPILLFGALNLQRRKNLTQLKPFQS